ncbi:MAG TPA: T9SS type A sorting domain-containing protein [Ignavibacteria bacterium]|nr:T9SS type A sorting domain-containing protein [Ignavibacteria bacterium]HMR00747.1 T9SS type A sorting domain-containing protein [Ignavibacteria bacterium]
MKTKLFILSVISLLAGNMLFAQSEILYNPGSIIDVGSGADICADAIIINGSFSGSGTICTGALPVGLSSFTSSVNKRDVTLMWVTEWEMNNSGFDIERSTPLNPPEGGTSEWKKIAFIPGHGTSNVSNGYLFKDEKLKTGKYLYRLKQLDYNGNYEYFPLGTELAITPPGDFEISQNYPNPSNPRSKINFQIPVNGRVTIKVYDITGREVITLLDEIRAADYYTVVFDGSNIASGVYFYSINARGDGISFTKTMKMILIK